MGLAHNQIWLSPWVGRVAAVFEPMGWACDQIWFSPWVGHAANVVEQWVGHVTESCLAQRLGMRPNLV